MGLPMPAETTYTKARAQLASLCDKVASTREPIFIHRRGAEDVALVSAAELRSLIETAHLLRSPKNAQRLITALIRSAGKETSPETSEKLRLEFDAWQNTSKVRNSEPNFPKRRPSSIRNFGKTFVSGVIQDRRIAALRFWNLSKRCCASHSPDPASPSLSDTSSTAPGRGVLQRNIDSFT